MMKIINIIMIMMIATTTKTMMIGGVNGNLRSWWLYDYKKLTMKLMMMVDHIMIGQTNYAAKSEHYEWKQGIVPKIKLNNFHDAQFNYAKEK